MNRLFSVRPMGRVALVFLVFLVFAAFASTSVLADRQTDSDPQAEVNHCMDSQVNDKWAALAAKHRDSDTWQRLFALRVGLCAMVERGGLSVGRASKIFERQRNKGVRELERHLPPKAFGDT